MSNRGPGQPTPAHSEFDLDTYTAKVLAIVPADGWVILRLKAKNKFGQLYPHPRATEPMQHAADPNEVAQIPMRMFAAGMRGEFRLFVHRGGDYSKYLWAWDIDLGPSEEDMPNQNPFGRPPDPRRLDVREQSQQSAYGSAPWDQPPAWWLQQQQRGNEVPSIVSAEIARLREEARLANDRFERLLAKQEEAKREAALQQNLVLVEQRHRDEIRELKSSIDRMSQPKESPTAVWLPLLGAVLPAVIEMQKGSRDDARAAVERQRIDAQEQSKLMITLFERRTDPVVQQLVQQVSELRTRGGGDQADRVVEALSKSLFGNFEMSMKMYQMLVENQPEASPVRELLGQAVATAQNLAQMYFASKDPNQVNHEIPPQQLPQGRHAPALQPARAPAQPATQPASATSNNSVDAALSFLINSGLPVEWHQRPWAVILSSLHNRESVEHVATLLARQVYHLATFDSLPELIAQAADPSKFVEALMQVVVFLPAWQAGPAAQEYVRAVLDKAASYLAEGVEPGDGEEDDPNQPDKEEDAPAPPTVTIVPGNGQRSRPIQKVPNVVVAKAVVDADA
jgi:hypothetical protein